MQSKVLERDEVGSLEGSLCGSPLDRNLSPSSSENGSPPRFGVELGSRSGLVEKLRVVCQVDGMMHVACFSARIQHERFVCALECKPQIYTHT